MAARTGTGLRTMHMHPAPPDRHTRAPGSCHPQSSRPGRTSWRPLCLVILSLQLQLPALAVDPRARAGSEPSRVGSEVIASRRGPSRQCACPRSPFAFLHTPRATPARGELHSAPAELTTRTAPTEPPPRFLPAAAADAPPRVVGALCAAHPPTPPRRRATVPRSWARLAGAAVQRGSRGGGPGRGARPCRPRRGPRASFTPPPPRVTRPSQCARGSSPLEAVRLAAFSPSAPSAHGPRRAVRVPSHHRAALLCRAPGAGGAPHVRVPQDVQGLGVLPQQRRGRGSRTRQRAWGAQRHARHHSPRKHTRAQGPSCQAVAQVLS